jgi:uncharacterized membrane protein YfcA
VTPPSKSYLLKLLAAGLAAGLLSGLLGVGGGVVMVPMLVLAAGFTQHRAHATSLLAVIPIAAVGAATFGFDDSISFGIAALLALGGLIGAPIGARLMSAMKESTLKIIFGCLGIVLGIVQVLR